MAKAFKNQQDWAEQTKQFESANTDSKIEDIRMRQKYMNEDHMLVRNEV